MMSKKMVQVNRNGVRFFGTSADRKKMRRHFKIRHFLRLPQFLSSGKLKELQKRIREASFFRKKHKNIATELCMRDHDAYRFLQFRVNDPRLFRFIEAVTECQPIGCFTGRVYRMHGAKHHDKWHNDMASNRLVGMSINLSENVYKDGHLIIRRKNKARTQRVIPNTGFGDALLFRLSFDLEHRVMGVKGNFPKTAYAGWYRTAPNFFDTVKRLRKRKKTRKRND